MKVTDFNITSIFDYSDLAQDILSFAGETKTFVFLGNLGAGKTTLVQHLCQTLNVKDPVNSPTFSIINNYKGNKGGKPVSIHHLDLYRLESLEEVLDIGIEELLESDDYMFIEWPELIEQILPEPLCVIKIQHLENNHRLVTCRLFEN